MNDAKPPVNDTSNEIYCVVWGRGALRFGVARHRDAEPQMEPGRAEEVQVEHIRLTPRVESELPFNSLKVHPFQKNPFQKKSHCYKMS